MKHQITAADILPMQDYARIRDEKRKAIIAIKQNRRVALGPYTTFYFENFDTMWLQVQEMLRIEKGGAEQLEDELRAYNPLVPNGKELTATVMFEIDDPIRRAQILGGLGGVEKTMELRLGGEIIKGRAEEDLDYTSEEGKASSVQFVHFPFTAQQIAAFKDLKTEVIVAISHPQYAHMAVMQQSVKQELAKDFD
ncbi:MAG: DUF3501 family protein [Alphaproteobacteria bacterium]